MSVSDSLIVIEFQECHFIAQTIVNGNFFTVVVSASVVPSQIMLFIHNFLLLFYFFFCCPRLINLILLFIYSASSLTINIEIINFRYLMIIKPGSFFTQLSYCLDLEELWRHGIYCVKYLVVDCMFIITHVYVNNEYICF